jgi:hypothetical protein
MPKQSDTPKNLKVPVNTRLVACLTQAVKQHLLNSGVEPAVINDEVIRAAFREYNTTPSTQKIG